MDPQHPDMPSDNLQPPLPVARPAAPPPDSEMVTAPLAPEAGGWWAPRPMSRLQALGDILLIGIVMIAPQVASMLIGSSVHTVAETPPVSRIIAANSLIWATVALVAVYLTWRCGQPLASIGFRAESPFAALAASVAATIAIYIALVITAIVAAAVTHAKPETMTTPIRQITELLGPPSWLTAFLIAATAGLFEEIVFRGFLLTRLRVLLGNWPVAIVLGSLLFAVPHIWEGAWAVVLIVPVAMVLSLTFVIRRGLIAPILAHFLFNFLQLAAIRALQNSPEWQRILGPSG